MKNFKTFLNEKIIKGIMELPRDLQLIISKISNKYPNRISVNHDQNMLSIHFHKDSSNVKINDDKDSKLAKDLATELSKEIKSKYKNIEDEYVDASGGTKSGEETHVTLFMVSDNFIK